MRRPRRFSVSGALVPLLGIIFGNALEARFAVLACCCVVTAAAVATAPATEHASPPLLDEPLLEVDEAEKDVVCAVPPCCKYERELVVGAAVFWLVGGKVDVTSYLTEYNRRTHIVPASRDDHALLVLWIGITLGRFLGLRQQILLRDASTRRLFLPLFCWLALGGAGFLLLALWPQSRTLYRGRVEIFFPEKPHAASTEYPRRDRGAAATPPPRNNDASTSQVLGGRRDLRRRQRALRRLLLRHFEPCYGNVRTRHVRRHAGPQRGRVVRALRHDALLQTGGLCLRDPRVPGDPGGGGRVPLGADAAGRALASCGREDTGGVFLTLGLLLTPYSRRQATLRGLWRQLATQPAQSHTSLWRDATRRDPPRASEALAD